MVLALKDTADFPIPTKNIVDNDANFNYNTVDSINAYDRTYLDVINANRTFFFPPANILIERSTDSGSTWTTVSTSDFSNENRGKLLSDIDTSLAIGTGNAATTQQLRVTLQSPGGTWYCSLDRAFIRFSRAGHITAVKIEASTYGAQSTYSTIVDFTTIDGWSGNNMYKFSRRTAWGTNASGHLYNVRFTFKYTSVNSSYISNQANVKKINMYGADYWGSSGKPRYAGHLYDWDYQQNVTFPAKVTSTNFTAPRFTATGSTYPYIAGNGLVTASATGGWVAGAGAIVLEPTSLRPSGSENGNISLGATGQAWKNIYLTGSIYKGSYTYTLPSATGTLALTSDIPTVNDATLTIQKNGTDVQTFTANQSTNATANITVPESFSDLTGTVSNSQIDWSSTLPGWSTFYIPTNNTDTTHTLTLKSGRTLTVTTANGGTGVSVTGGTAIPYVKVLKVKLGCKFGATNNSDPGIGNVNTNQTVFTRLIGQTGGSAINPQEQTHTTGSYNFTSLAGLGGNKTGINFEYTAIKWDSDVNWSLSGSIGYNNTNSWAKFEARCSSSTIPHIYQRGGTSASAVGFCIYEVFEES